MLRIRFSSEKATYKLGKKFGCHPATEAPELLQLARNLKLNVVGLSFHIGSSCEDYDAYCEAIKICRKLFDTAAQTGYQLNIVDLGGGYPGENFHKIDEFSAKINRALDRSFPVEEFPGLNILSEPGRYFVESAFTLVTEIHSRKITKDADGNIQEVMYYLNEGVYSNFLFVPLGPETVVPRVLFGSRSDLKFRTTIWGELEVFGYCLQGRWPSTARFRTNLWFNRRHMSGYWFGAPIAQRHHLFHQHGSLHDSTPDAVQRIWEDESHSFYQL